MGHMPHPLFIILIITIIFLFPNVMLVFKIVREHDCGCGRQVDYATIVDFRFDEFCNVFLFNRNGFRDWTEPNNRAAVSTLYNQIAAFMIRIIDSDFIKANNRGFVVVMIDVRKFRYRFNLLRNAFDTLYEIQELIID